jgi:hypothetical protein
MAKFIIAMDYYMLVYNVFPKLPLRELRRALWVSSMWRQAVFDYIMANKDQIMVKQALRDNDMVLFQKLKSLYIYSAKIEGYGFKWLRSLEVLIIRGAENLRYGLDRLRGQQGPFMIQGGLKYLSVANCPHINVFLTLRLPFVTHIYIECNRDHCLDLTVLNGIENVILENYEEIWNVVEKLDKTRVIVLKESGCRSKIGIMVASIGRNQKLYLYSCVDIWDYHLRAARWPNNVYIGPGNGLTRAEIEATGTNWWQPGLDCELLRPKKVN